MNKPYELQPGDVITMDSGYSIKDCTVISIEGEFVIAVHDNWRYKFTRVYDDSFGIVPMTCKVKCITQNRVKYTLKKSVV